MSLEMNAREYRSATSRDWSEKQSEVAAYVAKRANAIFGLNSEFTAENFTGDSIFLRYERSFTVGCDVQVTFRKDYEEETYLNRETGEKAILRKVNAKVELNWGGTSRGVAEAFASIALYEECAKLAAELESVFKNGWYSIRKG